MNHNTNMSIYDVRILKELIGIIVTVIIGVVLFMKVISSPSGSNKGDASESGYKIQSSELTTDVSSVDHNSDEGQINVSKANLKAKNGAATDSDAALMSLDIGAHEKKSGTANNAEFIRYSGAITYNDQVDTYSFVAPVDGDYRVDMTGMYNDTSVNLYLYDDLGYIIRSNTYCINESGLTGTDLKAGKTYSVKVEQDDGTPAYQLSIGMQKPTFDLTSYTEYNDSIEYIDQCNRYAFYAPVDGCYRFDMSGIQNGTDFDLYCFDSLGKPIKADTYCINGGGITVDDLKQGEWYEIQVSQEKGFSPYTLSIGYQGAETNIDGYSKVRDGVYFKDQRNIYSLTVAKSRTEISISGLAADTNVYIYVLNYLGETIVSDTYFRNGDSIMINNASVGDNHKILVIQDRGLSEYELSID